MQTYSKSIMKSQPFKQINALVLQMSIKYMAGVQEREIESSFQLESDF